MNGYQCDNSMHSLLFLSFLSLPLTFTAFTNISPYVRPLDPYRSLVDKKKEVMSLFTQCTKDDVTMNNYLTRSKSLDQF